MANKNNWKIKSVGDINSKNDHEKGRHDRIFNLKLATKIYAKSSDKIVLLFDEMEDLFKFDFNGDFSKSFLNRIIETTSIPIIWTCNNLDMMESSVLRRMTMSIKFDVPPIGARQSIWEHENKKQKLGLDEKTIHDLSEVYDVVPSVISTVSTIAKASKIDASKLGNIIENQVMLMNYGFKRKFNKILKEQDSLYDLSFVNSDLDLSKLTNQLKKSKSNFSLCLYGPPGTGKSAYGKYIARELGKQVLFKKASDLLGKYVGETEENIAKAFKQASDEDKVLIFDEADSFLGSRSAATHSWEISSVNEFLTQMESHNKPFICTTNLVKQLDAASLRRFTFKCNFAYMKKEQVSSIFLKYFNVEAPTYLLNSELLTPGDFAVVKKKADIMNITDSSELAKMLLEEAEAKPEYRHKIGF
jgi:SpoVK/Ycf46/Vps4 family AAA+-type ATPase